MTEKANILLVDDQPAKLLAYEAMLSQLDENLLPAHSGREALDLLLRHDITVVLMDVNMPEIDGFELASIIRGHPRFRDTAIIFVSAVHLSDLDRLRGYEAGAVDYVSVPVVPEILRAKVSVFVELHRRRHAWAQLNAELEQRVAQRTAELEASSERLRASEERFRFLSEMVPSIVWAAGPDGKLTYANRRWAEYCGAASADLLSDWPDYSLHPDDRERVLAERAVHLAAGEPFDIEARLRRYDGMYRWFMTRAAPRKLDGGEVVGWFGITTDTHDQVTMADRLREADRRKDEFLALLSHELRNPLAPLRNAVEIMRLKPDMDRDLTHCRDIMERQVNQLSRLVDDLLDVSRVTRGKINLQVEPIDLSNVLKDAVESSRPLIEMRRHSLEITMPHEPVIVNGDPVRLTQVVANLLNNAAKYQNEGGHIGLHLQRDGDKGRIRVTDNGDGIAHDKLSTVFDLFSQVDTSLDRAHGGLGIGLSLVRSIVALHGGKVQAFSEGVGLGSQFVVTLRCASVAASEFRGADSGFRARSSMSADKRRVLIVDDNQDGAESLSMLLRARGYTVSSEYQSTRVAALAKAQKPDIILLDVGMPDADGYEVCRQLRSSGLTDTLIVAITGYGQERDRKASMEAGFDAHFVKPVNLPELLQLFATDARQADSSGISM